MNRIESQSIDVSKEQKTRSVICPTCNTQGNTRHTCVRRNSGPSMG